MRTTVIHIPSFQGEYKSGLIFSMIEALKNGESFKLVCDENPAELQTMLKEANVPGLTWTLSHSNTKSWDLLIQKLSDDASVGCCGMCGGQRAGHGG